MLKNKQKCPNLASFKLQFLKFHIPGTVELWNHKIAKSTNLVAINLISRRYNLNSKKRLKFKHSVEQIGIFFFQVR